MIKIITISREFGSGFMGIEKSVVLIVDAVGGAVENE